MKRLVYSPVIKAYIKTDIGVFDISPYIVSGSTTRRVNQVSSAQLTFRNPQNPDGNMLWTEHKFADGKIGPVFHPMDPIIITMTRLQGHPVQVFTGYLDKAPYFQFYPGLCSIQASCTLKRLLYTQWDAALQLTRYFLEQYGWQLNSDTGIFNPTTDPHQIKADAKKNKAQFSDGSIGALLYAVITVIGEWDPSTVWIEALPTEMVDVINGLYGEFAASTKQGETLFKDLINQILAANKSLGQGAPSGAPGSTTTTGTGTGTLTGVGPRWRVKASQESTDYASNSGWGCDGVSIPAFGWSELVSNSSLGTLPCREPLIITNPSNNTSLNVPKTDSGGGSTGFPACIGLYPDTTSQLGFANVGEYDVIIQGVNKPIQVISGFGTAV